MAVRLSRQRGEGVFNVYSKNLDMDSGAIFTVGHIHKALATLRLRELIVCPHTP
jgi:hypothetical protein